MRKVSEPRHLPYYIEIGEHMLKGKGGSLLVPGDLVAADRKLLADKLAKIKILVAAILEQSNDVTVPFSISHGDLASLIDYGIVLGSLGPRSPTVRQRANNLKAEKARAGKLRRLETIDTVVAEETKDGAPPKIALERVNKRLKALGWNPILSYSYYRSRIRTRSKKVAD